MCVCERERAGHYYRPLFLLWFTRGAQRALSLCRPGCWENPGGVKEPGRAVSTVLRSLGWSGWGWGVGLEELCNYHVTHSA